MSVNFKILLCCELNSSSLQICMRNGFFGVKSRVGKQSQSSMHRCLGQKCVTQVAVSERAEDNGKRRCYNYLPKKKIKTHTDTHSQLASARRSDEFKIQNNVNRRCELNKCCKEKAYEWKKIIFTWEMFN